MKPSAAHSYRWHRIALALLAGALLLEGGGQAAEKPRKRLPESIAREKAGTEALEKSTEAIAELARNSIVTVGHQARGSRDESVGTGFVAGPGGLIATCLHVIGEGRPIYVRTADGRGLEVTEVHAWDRKLDLAVLRVTDANLPQLRLGDSDRLAQGASVVAIGNPLGLEQSVVEGVVSARREFEGVEMIQLAIPIEQGNS
ncbi:MAG TPA: trypsin-like peptidase domain-containing protein, partial [Verrucomicrobiae bacterium]|nr:trypsin-like peptidase domain-containing protein [Verrucomicrobiae bacterium]